jgi:hypothetical protein
MWLVSTQCAIKRKRENWLTFKSGFLENFEGSLAMEGKVLTEF